MVKARSASPAAASSSAPITLPTDWDGDTPVEKKLAWLHSTYKNPPPEHIGTLPKPTRKDNQKGKCEVCDGYHGLPAVHLDYLGHAELTDILCFVDPLWTWEPFATDDRGLPAIVSNDKGSVMWIRLTIWGVSRPGVGTSDPKGPDTMKELIGDALRNAGMRFGIGTALWSKIDGVDRKILSGQAIEPDADHDPNAQPGPEDQPKPAQRTTAKEAAAQVPDVWTYDGLVALGIRVLNPMCAERNLALTGKVGDYAMRLMDWQAKNATPTRAATDVPDDHRDEDEPAAEPPAGPPPGDQHPDDGTDPAQSDALLDDDGTPNDVGPGAADQNEDPDDLEEPDVEWDDQTADEASVASIVADVKKLKTIQARAYAAFRREKKLPTKPEQWTNGQLQLVVEFLDTLEGATA